MLDDKSLDVIFRQARTQNGLSARSATRSCARSTTC